MVYPDDREEYEAVRNLITSRHGAGSGIWTALRYGEKAKHYTQLHFVCYINSIFRVFAIELSKCKRHELK